MTIDFTDASIHMQSVLAATGEQLLAIGSSASVGSFDVDLLAAQSLAAPPVVEAPWLDVPVDESESLDISDDSLPTEQLMWLGVFVPVPQELQSDDVITSPVDTASPQEKVNLQPMAPVALPQLEGIPPVLTGKSDEVPDVESQSESIDQDTISPDTTELPTFLPQASSLPEPVTPESSPPILQTVDSLPGDSSLRNSESPPHDQVQMTIAGDETLDPNDSPAPDAENSVLVDQSAGVISFSLSELRSSAPFSSTQVSQHPTGHSVELRTELSEVVRHVRTMVVEHETRSTIQLEPAELGRMTLELIDAPEGRRAFVSAEDPAVMRFLERNVQLLENEARLQGVGQMSFTVGAGVSGGLGRGSQRQSEAEASFRKTIEWNTTPSARPRSRRELDTNA